MASVNGAICAMRMEELSSGHGTGISAPCDSLLSGSSNSTARVWAGSNETSGRLWRSNTLSVQPANRGVPTRMEEACRSADRPVAFLRRYVTMRPLAHAAILTAVLAAVGCSVGAQYGVKLLVDTLAGGLSTAASSAAWLAFALLVGLIAADNLLWRLAGVIAGYAFVGVTGDLRRDLFRHLTGQSPGYFADRMPGTLTGRITATSNAVYTLENMFVWNVLPPCAATFVAIIFVGTVSLPMAAILMALAAILVATMFRLAAAGKPLHHEFAHRAAAVDGEMVDVVGNMSLVLAFCGLGLG